jgi:hypothetical protein
MQSFHDHACQVQTCKFIFDDTFIQAKLWRLCPSGKFYVCPSHVETLFWLCSYPILDLLLILFKIYPRTCTTVLKRTTVTVAKTLKEEVKFPSDTEMENLKEASFQNFAFCDCVCIIDGN